VFSELLALTTSDELDSLEQELEDFEQIDLVATRQRLVNDLHAYVVHFWSQVEPAHDFIDGWHIHEMCDVLMRVEAGEEGYDQVIFNVPPGTSKSVICSVFFPSWCWARSKKYRFLTASYGQSVSTRDNLRVRDLVMSAGHQRLFPLKLDEDQNTKTRYNTEAKGWRIATSVDGVGTGEHPHFIILDDLISAQESDSEAARKAANEFIAHTISTRGVSIKVRIILVMQRLHEDDPTGFLMQKGGWRLICFPMRFEQCSCTDEAKCIYHVADPNWRGPDPRDHREKDGELLSPDRFTPEMVAKMELLLENAAAGQLQQRPTNVEGQEFQRAWFHIVDEKPKHGRRVRGWDTAGTEDDGDYTVGVKVCEEWVPMPVPGKPTAKPVLAPSGRIFIEDVVRGQWGPDDVDTTMRQVAAQDGKDVAVREEQEGGASGKAVVAARLRSLKGYDYEKVTLGANKRVRRKPFRAQCKGGNVYLVRGPWNEAYIQEMCALPNGKHDDQGDGTSCAYNSVLLEPPPGNTRVTW